MDGIVVEQLKLGRRKRARARSGFGSPGSSTQTASLGDVAWELAQDLALEKFYIKRENRMAEEPAFLLFYGFLSPKWALLWDHLAIFQLDSKAKAYAKLQEFADKSIVPIEIVLKTRRGYKVVAKGPRLCEK